MCVCFALCEYGDFSWAGKAGCSLQKLSGILSTGDSPNCGGGLTPCPGLWKESVPGHKSWLLTSPDFPGGGK